MPRTTIKTVSLMAISTLAISSLSALVAPAAMADENTENGWEVEVVAESLGKASSTSIITNERWAKIGGRPQVAWEQSDHDIKVDQKGLNQAPFFRITATGPNSSAAIYKKAKGSNVVVLKKKSKVRNTGRQNGMRVGFVWTTQRLTVLSLHKASGQYRHTHDLLTDKQLKKLQKTVKKWKYNVVGKVKFRGKTYNLVEWCGNWIGGEVPMVKNPIQVRFEEEVELEGDGEAEAEAKVKIDYVATCPTTGAVLNVTGEAMAYAYASGTVSYTRTTKIEATGPLEYRAVDKLKIDNDARAAARASIRISGTCGKPPVPEVPDSSLDLDELNDLDLTDPNCEGTPVECQSWTVFSAHLVVPEGVDGTLKVDASYGVARFTANNATTIKLGTGTHRPEIKFVAPTEMPADGSQYAIIKVTYTPSKGKAVEDTSRIRLNPVEQPPL